MKPMLWLIAFSTLLLMSLASNAANVCTVTSGAGTAAVVELYTSEGCSSCPPADRALSQLRRKIGASGGVVIPLGMHVTYWDGLGWRDILAQKLFDARQQELAAVHRQALVYTPEFFVNGEEIGGWRDSLPALIHEINSRPAKVAISLSATSTPTSTSKTGNWLTLKASAVPRESGLSGSLSLYLAIAEDGLVSHVLRGENGGTTLSHDNAVRVWLGPFSMQRSGIDVERQVNLPPQWDRQHLWVAALVQDARDDVLQAVATRPCD